MREQFSLRIEGTRPYLMSAFKAEKEQAAKGNPTPEEDCENALYRNAAGQIYVPSMQVWASMRDASRDIKRPWSKRQKLTQIVISSVFVDPEELVISPQTWSQFSTAVRIPPRTGARVFKSRPRFENWALELTITNTEARLKGPVLRSVLEEAGQYQGIGDWRPRFGTYKVSDWKPLG